MCDQGRPCCGIWAVPARVSYLWHPFRHPRNHPVIRQANSPFAWPCPLRHSTPLYASVCHGRRFLVRLSSEGTSTPAEWTTSDRNLPFCCYLHVVFCVSTGRLTRMQKHMMCFGTFSNSFILHAQSGVFPALSRLPMRANDCVLMRRSLRSDNRSFAIDA